jgi:hypothetical protein
MIRFASAIFRDDRMDQRVRRATPLISTQQFPTVSLLLPAQICEANAVLTWKWNEELLCPSPFGTAVIMAGADASSVAEGRS